MGLNPAILIDTGTATTFDILSSDGAYVGGMIAPGVHVSAQALAQAAAQLPLVLLSSPHPPLAPIHARPCNRACFGAMCRC